MLEARRALKALQNQNEQIAASLEQAAEVHAIKTPPRRAFSPTPAEEAADVELTT